MSGEIHVGTSGWHYNHWRGPFYPEKFAASKMLAFYAERLRTVEINNSFYRLPTEKAFRDWRAQVPRDFCFAVKGSRFITHMKKLKDPESSIDLFFARVHALRPKLGPVLFQLPPHWRRDTDRFQLFLAALPKRIRYAFEFREPSWFDPEIYRLLRKYNAALCVYQLAGMQSPRELTADWAYLRLHGPEQSKYTGRYTRDQLRSWLGLCRQWTERKAKDVYVYFDNDQAGHAAINAMEFEQMAAGAERREGK
jgi:uncharacterized protein YecE (DUF72 family)